MGDIMKRDKFINVAIGRSRKELNYANLNLPYLEFIDKYIKNTKYTNETYKEYINFPKDIQDNIKDVGGFVGGVLKDGKVLVDGKKRSLSIEVGKGKITLILPPEKSDENVKMRFYWEQMSIWLMAVSY